LSRPLASILSKLVEFNPKKRWSAEKVLQMSYFDNIRNTKIEKEASSQVFVAYDDIDDNQ
jgi:serine/threonine protein kinase